MNKKEVIVELAQPIKNKDGEEVNTVALREPLAGEMRGLSFTNIMQLDVETMTTLIPRISELTERQMSNLSPLNMTPLFTAVVGFFVHIDSAKE